MKFNIFIKQYDFLNLQTMQPTTQDNSVLCIH